MMGSWIFEEFHLLTGLEAERSRVSGTTYSIAERVIVLICPVAEIKHTEREKRNLREERAFFFLPDYNDKRNQDISNSKQ